VLTSLEVEFLGEVVNRLFEAHTGKKSTERYKPSAGLCCSTEDDWNSVFESRYSTQQDGTGLSLAIVKEIVTAHGWRIQLTESEEDGARFEISGLDLSRQND